MGTLVLESGIEELALETGPIPVEKFVASLSGSGTEPKGRNGLPEYETKKYLLFIFKVSLAYNKFPNFANIEEPKVITVA
jgi:hypothetical protein